MDKSKAISTVDAYMNQFDEQVRERLIELRTLILETVPDAEESMSYGMPAYKWNGVLVYFAGYKKHIGFYPTGSGVAAFTDELTKFKTSKGTIQLPIDKKIPKTLLVKIIKFRMRENIKKNKEKIKKK